MKPGRNSLSGIPLDTHGGVMELTALRCAALVAALLTQVPQSASAGAKIAAAEFDGMDTNADGTVSADAHAAATRGMFVRMDGNADSVVTAAEMTAAREQITGTKSKPGDLSAAVKIKVIDSNGDRLLSADEHAAGSARMFGKMDTNKDGKLTRAEFDAGHRTRPADGQRYF